MEIPLLLLFIAIFVVANGEQKKITVRFCAPGAEYKRCEELRLNLLSEESLSETRGTVSFSVQSPGQETAVYAGSLSCVPAQSSLECTRMIQKGTADVMRMKAEELFGIGQSPQFRDLVPIAAGQTLESCPPSKECHKFAREYSVAIVKKISGIRSLADLRDKRACFGGMNSTAGWTIPIFKLLSNWSTVHPIPPPLKSVSKAHHTPKLVFVQSKRSKREAIWSNVSRYDFERLTERCPLDLTVANDVFPQSCAPGLWAQDEYFASSFSQRLCGSCEGRNQSCRRDRRRNDPFYCLTSGKGDVAFLSSRQVDEYFKRRSPDEFGILCQSGLHEVHEYAFCHWGVIPEDAYVVSSKKKVYGPQVFGNYVRALHFKAKNAFVDGLDFLADKDVVAEIMPLTRIYESVPNANTYLRREGGQFFFASLAQGFPGCGAKDRMRFCIFSQEEKKKCELMQVALRSAGLPDSLECVVGYSEENCVRMINSSQADLAMISSHRALLYAAADHVIPVLDEVHYKDSYAVAVALKTSRAQSLNDLSSGQLNVCSAGTDSFSGWEAPNKVLMDLEIIPEDSCRLAEAWAKLFQTSCIPGSRNTTVSLGRNETLPVDRSAVEGLCAGCGGGQGACLTPSEATDYRHEYFDTYYGDVGALRCLVRRKADVAFFKSNALETMKLLKTMNDVDFRTINTRDLILLCPDGSRKVASKEAIKACNLGQVPDRWMVGRRDADRKQMLRWQDLWKLAENRARGSYDWFKTTVRLDPGATTHLLDLIFSNTTMDLRRFPIEKQPFEFYRREAYHGWENPFQRCSGSSFRFNFLCYFFTALLTLAWTVRL